MTSNSGSSCETTHNYFCVSQPSYTRKITALSKQASPHMHCSLFGRSGDALYRLAELGCVLLILLWSRGLWISRVLKSSAFSAMLRSLPGRRPFGFFLGLGLPDGCAFECLKFKMLGLDLGFEG